LVSNQTDTFPIVPICPKPPLVKNNASTGKVIQGILAKIRLKTSSRGGNPS
jgi:hypothetical protein